MKAVVKTLYFSPKTDADLIAVYYQIGAKAFAKAIKESLRMTIRPGYTSEFIEKLSLSPLFDKTIKDSISINISFCAEGDEDIRTLLSKTKTKKMSSFIKMTLRYAIGPYMILGYYLQGDNTLTNIYQKKELFFIEGLKERISTKIVQNNVETIEKSKETVSIKPKETTGFVPIFEEKITEPKIETSNQIELETSSDNDDFDDDDILQMLLDM